MEENDDGDELSTPFWVQSSTNIRNLDRLRRRISSFFFSSGLVIFILLVIALFFLIFVVPSTLSFSIFRPNSVKKSWDSLNIVLVLVAVVFGFLSRIINNNNENHQENEAQKLKPSNSDQWFNYDTITIDEQKQPTSSNSISEQWNYKYPDPDYYHHAHKFEQKYTKLRKNSSYPKMGEFSSNRWDDQLRSYNDFEVDAIRVSDLGKVHRRHRSVEEVCSLRTLPQIKSSRYIDTSVSEKATVHSPSSSSPIGIPAPTEYEEKVHFSETVQRRKDRSNRDLETTTAIKPPPAPPPVQPEFQEKPKRVHNKARSTRNLNKDMQSLNPNATPLSPPPHHKRSRSGATGSATKDFLNSLYQKKKKKPRQKSLDNLDSLIHQAQDPLTFQQTPPPPAPPPPPPQPSVFQNLFLTKKQKIKRTITVSLTPGKQSPATPPHTTAIEPTLTSQNDSLPTQKPPRDIKMRSLDQLENYSNSGGESPLNHIPPPPPPPPPAFFKNTGWKFVMQGDYVRIDSSTSSRSESPDLDEMDSDISPSASTAVGGDVTHFHPSPLYCPSPDVNTKAESFINNFRAKLKLEKNHSMNKKLGLSGLGPSRSPNQN